jgi:hypothetical protein
MSALDEAKDLCRGDREKKYGHPHPNHQSIGLIWTGILGAHGILRDNAVIPPEVVAMCMLGVKLSREAFTHTRDNIVDMAGYTYVLERIIERSEVLTNGGGSSGVSDSVCAEDLREAYKG